VTNERKALIFGLISVAMWSTVATGFKLGLAIMTVSQLLFLGTLFSWLIFLFAALAARSLHIEVEDRWLVAGLGLLNPFIYYLTLFTAYDLLPAHVAQPINYTWAITLALLSIPILKQRLTARNLIAIVISYAGVVVVLTSATMTSDKAINTTGVFLALISTIFWALYWLLNTRCRSEPRAIMFWSFTAALPPITLTALILDGLPAITPTNILYGTWVGALEMGITFLTWQTALRLTDQAARIGQLIFLSPFLSMILIYLVLGEAIGWGAVLGLAVIVAGLHLNQKNPSAN